MNRARVRIPDEPILLREAAGPGTICGLIGAGLMALVAVLFAAAQGDPWMPMKWVAATFLGQRALGPGFQAEAVLLGTMVHLLFAVALGLFFVWLGGFMNAGAAVGWGVVFSLSIWVIMQFGILPVINPILATAPPIPFAVAHVVFGLSLGSYPRFLKQRSAVQAPAIQRKAA